MLTEEEARSRLATHPLPANAWVYATDRAIVIKAEYTDTIERLLRWVPKARWSAKQRCWIVPLSGLELVRSILPELSRLAEAMQPQPVAAEAADTVALPVDAAARDESARKLFRDNARLLFGSDWQRETARALKRDEAARLGVQPGAMAEQLEKAFNGVVVGQVLETLAKTGLPSRAEITDAVMGERAECVAPVETHPRRPVLQAMRAVQRSLDQRG